ncbi:MAG: Cell morphogenesis protein PAG1 [Candelina submexicana]|nr:MAG: Cell morphogenesis protein PAG1 [Candelina submexicana]
MAGLQQSQVRQHVHPSLQPDDGDLASHSQRSPISDSLSNGGPSTLSARSSDAPVSRGRGLSAVNGPPSNLQHRPAAHPTSPRVQAAKLGSTRMGGGSDGALDRRPSLTYGHHRQTSIVHGIQHSRNASFVNSPATSPLSPNVSATAAAGNGVGSEVPSLLAPNSVSVTLPSHLAHVGVSSVPNNTVATSASLNERATNEAGSDTGHARRLERKYSGKARRDHSHHNSHSRHHHHHHHHQPELKTVGEFALHHLFNSFVGQADDKINQCITASFEYEPDIEQVCGPGMDLNFDQLISALGHIARQKPKALIDTLMYWRKAKSEATNVARAELNQRKASSSVNGPLMRRNTEPLHTPSDSTNGYPPSINSGSSIVQQQKALDLAERKSTVAIYLLCRVLMEIIGQSNLACVTPEMADRLEEIIFSQLKAADPEQLSNSSLRSANWSIFSQLLGVMSEINFESVWRRYVSDLETTQGDAGGKGSGTKEHQGKTEIVIRGMWYLRIKTYPDDAWARSCEFVQSLGNLFAKSHGPRIKHAYCRTIATLLLPVAAKANAELNVPKWRQAIETIDLRLSQLLVKPRHWSEAFPLRAILLCVSPPDVFAAQWLHTLSSLQPKLKDKSSRGMVLQAICRLVWTYLYQGTDTLNVTTRKLEEIVRLVVLTGKKSYVSAEPNIAEPLIQLIRIIGFKHQDFCFRTIIFPLMNADLFASGKDLKVEQLEPEKMVIGIRAFLAIMADLESGDQGEPPFPLTFAGRSVAGPWPAFPVLCPSRLSDARPSMKAEEMRFSVPVVTTGFGEAAKESYTRFCTVLGKVTLICDNAFGGQAVLDEKFGGGQAPKTPIAESFNFSRKEENQGGVDQKQGFYDLLQVAVQALPRCRSAHIPFNSLVNLLCTGTAHVQGKIAASSAQSLKSIARQSYAQQVTIGFARFIFNYDDRYSTMSDGGMLGPGHIESTLKLYVELLQIWIEEIKQKTNEVILEPPDESNPGSRGVQLDLSGIWAYVDEIESHGLFFLCSQSRRVRSFAVTVLRLITEFDTALGKENTRIIEIMEGDAQRVMNFNDDHLSVAERSRLQRGMRKNNAKDSLIEFCSSDISYDATLWFKIFPNLIRISFERCPFAVTLAREIICARLLQMHTGILALAEAPRGPQHNAFEIVQSRSVIRYAATPPEVMIEQWKLYLIVACTTLINTGGQQNAQAANTQQAPKSSKVLPQAVDRISSARSLFTSIVPLLSVGPTSIRDAVVIALGSININLYKTLLESLLPAVLKCNEEAKMRIRVHQHQRTASNPRRSLRTDRLRTEITQVYKLTSHFLHEKETFNDDWILNNLVTYTKDLRIFLSDAGVQNEWEFQKLRRHYCGLTEELFEGINRTKDPSRWMPFESRKSAFALMEDWCGYSPNQNEVRLREDSMRRSVMDLQRDYTDKGTATAAMEIEKRNLKTAALSAMAALCGGPISITTESKANLQFDVRRMLSWIDTIFRTISDRTHAIGRRALKNLILHNKEYPYLLERSIEMCYSAETPKALESYFDVVAEVLYQDHDDPLAFRRVLGASLFILGNEKSELRMKSARLLRALEERQQKSSKIQDFDISISDKTTAVYKLAQFEISKRLAAQHSEHAFLIFCEFTLHFKALQSDHQRSMVAAILPWIQTIELQLDPNGGPTAHSYMLLANLFEITIRSSSVLHNEVQALWQALATGPHGGNVQLVLDFIIQLCLDRREQNFVDYAKQIVVYLSSTPAGLKVVEFLLLQLTPKAMVQEKRNVLAAPPETQSLPYLADLSLALPIGNKQTGFSLAQLSLILLVDLMVSPVQLGVESVPLLLQVVFILWDHYTPLVQDQAREMLVHLIHELVISKIENGTTQPDKKSIEDLIEMIRRHDSKIVWVYEECNGKDEIDGNRVPVAMEFVAAEVAAIFSITYPGLRAHWGRSALSWATSCPVRHMACRSFQVFRCILTALDQDMLSDMLARLSNTIADNETDIQTFSMEILTTLKTIIGALDPLDLLQYPQLYWATCACLNTIHEREFMESLSMLEKYLDKINLSDSSTSKSLMDCLPPRWEGPFDGIQPLIYKGLRSATSLDRSLNVLRRLAPLPHSDLIGDSSRLLFVVLGNLPHFLDTFGQDKYTFSECKVSAEVLAQVAESQGCALISRVLTGFVNSRYRTSQDFLSHIVSALRSAFFPLYDFKTLVFLMGLLTNKLPWFKIRTMQLLCVIIPEIDMQKPEFAGHGPDLIAPLLQLLQTEFCPQALEVLDHIMTMCGTPMNSQHLRMSIAGSHSRAMRKEYERTASLFGIPEETGWSIPMPAMNSSTTRNNVHAVFYTCAPTESMETGATATADVEFHMEDCHYGSYFPERTATMLSDEVRVEGNMGELVMKLDSLDDFFENDGNSQQTFTGLSANNIPDLSFERIESETGSYDQQTLTIFHDSVGRTASVSSVQIGFTDSPTSAPSDPKVMTPTAFATPPVPPIRPGLHSRSVTSPSVNAYKPSNRLELLLSDDETDEVFSDDELSTHAVSGHEGSYFLESMIRPLAQGTRSRMRRLTGSGGKEKDRQRATIRSEKTSTVNRPMSPQVPRVPSHHLQQPRSSEG